MDDKELMICLMKRCLELEEEIEKQKLSGDYWFRECERLKMNRSNDNGLSRAEFEYLYDTDNKEPETDKSPEYESLEWLKEVYYAYQEYR